jgi:hypothetical protein
MKLALVILIAACGSGVSDDPVGAGTFDEESPSFQMALCKIEGTCNAKDEAECLRDVGTDMAYAKELLDDAGEQRCAACMHAKRVEYDKVLAAACDLAAADPVPIREACDLNPNDGVDKTDEACAGLP